MSLTAETLLKCTCAGDIAWQGKLPSSDLRHSRLITTPAPERRNSLVSVAQNGVALAVVSKRPVHPAFLLYT